MRNPLATKLRSFAELSEDDAHRIDRLCSDVRTFRAKHDLIKQGDRPEVVFLLLEGWACRYKVLSDGRRHIMAYLVPGDLCDVRVFLLKEMDHAIALLSDAKVAAIQKDKIIRLFEEHHALERALWWSTLVDESVLREWLVNIGQRDAFARLAHLVCELRFRLDVVGLVDGNSFDLPLTQTDLGDTLGLTSVHVNRTLQQLRSENLITLARGRVHIPDVGRLQRAASFDPRYLHLDRRPDRSDA